MEWVRRNQTVIPWALLGADLSIRLVTRLYKTYYGYYQDDVVVESPAYSRVPQRPGEEAADSPYPPEAYPGARDVVSPYGSLRVYEWGPEHGRKVLIVHGITNPCVAVGGIAEALVDRGCRVIIFDLPGRGYSSAPIPTPQSTRLFTTCVLLAITSSPISWTGNTRFSLIGYSLGGGIATNFTSYFPSLVSSLVLLAPAGLVRTSHINITNKLIYNYGLLDGTLLENVVTRRLRSGAPPIAPRKPSVTSPASSETPKIMENTLPLSKSYPDLTMPKVIPWQLEANRGFVKAYISSLRYGPISNQHDEWTCLGQRLNAQKLNAEISKTDMNTGLQNGKVLIICGKNDVLIIPNELREDAAKCLGPSNFELKEVDAGHELPITRTKEIVDFIWKFWEQ